MEQFMRKYSFYLTSMLGLIAAVVLVVKWNDLTMLQKLPIIYIVALALHEIEELKFPGGFVELVTSMTGLQLKNIGVAKFGLLTLTIYATVVPAFISNFVWPVMSTLLIGFVELFAHLASARVNKGKFYSPGMITAVLFQFPVAVYGFCYLFANDMVKDIYWLFAVLLLLPPTLCLQAAIVRSNGQKYGEFINNARKAMFSRRK